MINSSLISYDVKHHLWLLYVGCQIYKYSLGPLSHNRILTFYLHCLTTRLIKKIVQI